MVACGCDQIVFYLKDDCGVIRVQPERARVEALSVFDETCGRGDDLYYTKGPARAVADSTHRRRFVEHAILLHSDLYVIGQARERDDLVAPEIAHDPRVEMFLISRRSEDEVRRGVASQFWICGVLGAVFAIGGFIIPDAKYHLPLDDHIPKYLLVGGTFGLAWFLGWVGMVYNSMIGLRQRVRQAWANVDVQLKRRHHLIPNLVAIVNGMRDYEKNLQTELALLRRQLMATPPGEPGPDPQAATETVRAIAERYPELKANTSFLNLQENLVDTEQRIARARSYFNDIASFYNIRLHRISDRLIAALARMKPRALMAAADFERRPSKSNWRLRGCNLLTEWEGEPPCEPLVCVARTEPRSGERPQTGSFGCARRPRSHAAVPTKAPLDAVRTRR